MISRFCFNISIQENLKNILNILFFKKNNFELDLKKEMSKIYNNSNFYFFDYGRTAFFEILSEIKKKTKKINNLRSLLYFIVIGSMALLLGSIGPKFSVVAIKNYAPYLLFYIAVWLVFSIESIQQDDKSFEIAGSSPRIRNLVGATTLIIVGAVMGFQFDDPVASTVSTVYLPFLLVALIMPAHIRHLQRARIYGVFLPAVFLVVRFPWFLIPLCTLFFLLRLYHYFRFNIVYPTFGVDHD